MLWLVLTLFNLPSLIFWINNFRFNQIPQWDLSLYLCLMLTPAIAILWQDFCPDFNPTMWKMQRHLCYMMGLVTVLWGTHRFYLLCLMIVLVLITLAMCQLISRFAEPEDVPQPPSQDNQPGSAETSASEPKKTEKPPTDESSTSGDSELDDDSSRSAEENNKSQGIHSTENQRRESEKS